MKKTIFVTNCISTELKAVFKNWFVKYAIICGVFFSFVLHENQPRANQSNFFLTL